MLHRRRSTTELLTTYRRTRDRATRNRIVERHLALAERIAADYQHRGIDRADLVQVAMLALVKAVDRFDPERGSPFTVFASITINGELKRHFRDHGWSVRPPRAIQEAHLAVRGAADNLVQRLGRPARVDELAAHTGLDTDQVLIALAANHSYRAESIEAGPTDGVAAAPNEPVGADSGFDAVDDRLQLEEVMAGLPEREQTILRLRFWEDYTQSEIADVVGVSQMHVSRLLRRTIEQLHHELSTSAV